MNAIFFSRRSVAALLIAFCGGATAAELTVSEYRSELKSIRAALDTGDLSAAQRFARKLDSARISAPVPFKADASILDPILKARSAADAAAQKNRLNALITSLDGGEQDANAGRIDAGLLEKLRRDEEITLPPKDGEAPQLDDQGWIDEIGHHLRGFFKWIGDKLSDLLDRLAKLIPSSGSGGGIGTVVNVILFTAVAAVLILVVWMLLKKRKFKAMPAASTPVQAPAKDADPLSRGADEWEQYAVQLAGSGRYREAIRAWYHAALVLLFRAGVLSYRKGRTNWEYCYALPQELPARSTFQQLTGAFEIEWYGKAESSQDSAGAYAAAAKQFITKTRGGRSA
ncbi:MAG TPA: DUF4129 domain-containing protein [Planctomycetota bacterium]|nr:DUF4129 domain-containing protein [Planctomycetota bacterium]